MRALMMALVAAGLTGCLVDPDAVVDEAELRVTVLGAQPTATALQVELRQGADATPAVMFEPAPGATVDLYVRALDYGAWTLTARTLNGDRLLQCARRSVENTAGQQHVVVDLERADPSCSTAGGADAGPTDAALRDAAPPPPRDDDADVDDDDDDARVEDDDDDAGADELEDRERRGE